MLFKKASMTHQGGQRTPIMGIKGNNSISCLSLGEKKTKSWKNGIQERMPNAKVNDFSPYFIDIPLNPLLKSYRKSGFALA